MRKELRFSEQSVLKIFSIPLLTFLAILLSVGVSAQKIGFVNSPCNCLSNQTKPGNGQFQATIRLIDGGVGPWTLSSVSGFYDPSSAPLSEFTPNTTVMTDMGGGVFELTGIHIDGVGFDVEVKKGVITRSISMPAGRCQYPRTKVQGDSLVCTLQKANYWTQEHEGSTYYWTLLNDGGEFTSSSVGSFPFKPKEEIQWNGVLGGLDTVVVRETAINGCIVRDTLEVKFIEEDTLTIACNNLVQVSLDANCGGELVPDMFLEGQVYNDESFSLIIEDSKGEILNYVSLADTMIGEAYTVTVVHDCSGMMCWSKMMVLDKLAPELKCHADTIKCYESMDPFQLKDGFPVLDKNGDPLSKSKIRKVKSNPPVYIATETSSCSDLTLRYYDETVEQGCGNKDFSSITYRNWIVTDKSGNMSTCKDTINMTRVELKDIKYPPHRDGLSGVGHKPFLQACGNYKKDHNGNPHPDVTGSPVGDLCGDFMINYTDHKRIPLCGADDDKSYKVLREWTVMDNCDPDKLFDTIQVIAVMDTKAPRILQFPKVKNDTLTVEAGNYDCGALVELPTPVVIDCSKTTTKVEYQLVDESGNLPDKNDVYELLLPNAKGVYILDNVNKGIARVKYTATDACGNTREKIIYIKVIDNLLPQAICDQHTSITLDEFGKSYLSKESLDDDSYDNCSDVTLLVRRDSSCDARDFYWGEGVHFCCDDTQYDSVMVELQVKDVDGNTSKCMAWVEVNDWEKPKIKCPTSGQVSCKFDYSDLSVFGTVRESESEVKDIYITDPENGGKHYFGKDGFASDNCLFKIEELPPSKSINSCGRGHIIRRFKAIDGYNNSSNICSQRIEVIDFDKFEEEDIDWPDNVTVEGCVSNKELVDPDSLAEGYGWPKLLGEDQCSMIAMDYEDVVFSHIEDENICHKILRTWRILDECNYNPNGVGGYWEKVQVIMVNETEAPVIDSGCTPVDTIAAGDCNYKYVFEAKGHDNCTPDSYLKWYYKINVNNSQTDTIVGKGSNFDVVLSKGTHSVTLLAQDECGNISKCKKVIKVEDTKKPTPLCITTLVTVLLGDEGEATINAADFNHYSFDDCTRSNYGTCECLTDLKFSFSKNVYNREMVLDCSDVKNGIRDTIELSIYVTDESGNQDFCNTNIILQDNNDHCEDILPAEEISYYNVSGVVAKLNAEPLPGVKLDLISENTELISESVSDDNGAFEFKAIAGDVNYTINTKRDDDYLNGLTTLDLVLIQKHILGIQKFDSPYKLIAADANNSGSVTAADILILRKLILGVIEDIQFNDPWIFIDKDIVFENENRPFDFDREIEINDITSDVEKNIIAIKIGDVNISANAGNKEEFESRSEEVVYLITDDKQFNGGQNVRVPVYIQKSDELVGMQFTIKYDPFKLNFSSISNGELSVGEGNINTAKRGEGIVTFSWNLSSSQNIDADKELFVINFNSNESGKLSNSLTVNSELTRAEIYTHQKHGISENPVKLQYRGIDDNVGFELLQNRPNPFSEETTIEFTIPKTQMAVLTVYDVSGRILYSVEKEFQKGKNSIRLTRKDLNEMQGVMYFKLETDTNSASRKMILIR